MGRLVTQADCTISQYEAALSLSAFWITSKGNVFKLPFNLLTSAALEAFEISSGDLVSTEESIPHVLQEPYQQLSFRTNYISQIMFKGILHD